MNIDRIVAAWTTGHPHDLRRRRQIVRRAHPELADALDVLALSVIPAGGPSVIRTREDGRTEAFQPASARWEPRDG